MKNKKLRFSAGVIIMALGLSLVFMAAFLIANNYREDAEAGENVAVGLDAVQEYQAEMQSQAIKLGAGDFTPDYQLDPNREMPVVTDENGCEYIGEIDIPSLELNLPVQSDWSYPGLKISPCRYTGSAYLDDLTIAAHNYTTHFGKLKNLSKGDAVSFTDADGNRFDYTVESVQEIAPRPTDQVSNSGYDLVLFTCTLGGASRVAVFCNLSSVEE